jgi:integrase
MANKLLTDRFIRALKPAAPGKRYDVFDTNVPGFGIRVSDDLDKSRPGKAGRISFILYSRFPASPNPTRRKLGSFGTLTLKEARDKAIAWGALIHQGIDPAAAEEEARQANARERDNTFAAVAEDFIRHIHANRERKAAEVERDLREHFIKPWGSRPISTIKAADIAAVIEATVRRGKRAHAHNLFGHIRRLFGWAVPLRIEYSPCSQLSPRKLIGERVRRDRVLTDDEIRCLWRATARIGYPYGPLYRLLLLSAVRLTEACEATWSEFDLKAGTWEIPAARMKKTGGAAKPHLVPLTEDILKVLENLPRFKSGQYLFSNQAGRTPLRATGFSKPKVRLDRRMLRTLQAMARKAGDNPKRVELPDWTNHDIRRSVRSHLSALRIPVEVAEAVLAHAKPGVRGVYDRHSYFDEMKAALSKWGERLAQIVEPKRDNVVQFGVR